MKIDFSKKYSQQRRSRLPIALLLLVGAALTLFCFQKVEAGPAEVTLIHTSSVTGHLFPCPS